MPNNISKYIQITDFLLLEYEFNRDGSLNAFAPNSFIIDTCLGSKYFIEGITALGNSNNVMPLNSIPVNSQRTTWLLDSTNYASTYPTYWDSSTIITGSYYKDTVKLHIVSGYNFDDVGGFLLQIQTNSSTNGLVDLANFTYAKQPQINTGNITKFATNTLFLGNRFYDKYIEFKIPSIQALGANSPATTIGNLLNVNYGADVYITYSTIFDIVNNRFLLDEQLTLQLPVTSVADNFNCFIAESTSGDFIEYYALWGDYIIGEYIGDIESGRIQLYTSNNPNDNAEEFSSTYGYSSRKWVLIHEISVYEHIPGGTSLLTQKYSFTQDSNFSTPNYFRPILTNSDIASSYSIQYTCRLMNRMDGTQIIRKASFSSTDPKKYGNWLTRLNVENLIPYKVFNKIEAEAVNNKINQGAGKTKYIKVFYDIVQIVLNEFNEVFPQGTGPLFLKSYDSVYKFKFEKIDNAGDRINVDLSGAFNYSLLFKLDDNSRIEIGPTYSTNMNTTIGEIEFKLTEDQLAILKKQTNDNYSIVVKNPNGTQYSFYEGKYYDINNQKQVIANYQALFEVDDLKAKIADLEVQLNKINGEIN